MSGRLLRAGPFRHDRPPPSPRAPRIERGAVVAPLLVAAIGGVVFAWILSLRFTTWVTFEDFRFHNRIAARLASGAPLEVPHPLYEYLVVSLHALTPARGFGQAGFAVAVAAQVVLALVVYAALRRDTGPGARPSALAAAATALPLCLVAPIYLLTPARREFYFGYIYPNAFHSPTMVLLRPLALGVFLVCVGLLAGRPAPAPLRAALVVACGLAKPSYLMCLIPALILIGIAEFREPARAPRWRAMIVPVLAPAIVLLAVQAWFTLVSERMAPSNPSWAPLAAVFAHSRDSVPWAAVKFVLSVLFPLTVLLAFPGEVRREPGLRLADLRDRRGLYVWARRARAAPASRELPLVRPGDPVRPLRGLGTAAAGARAGLAAGLAADLGLCRRVPGAARGGPRLRVALHGDRSALLAGSTWESRFQRLIWRSSASR